MEQIIFPTTARDASDRNVFATWPPHLVAALTACLLVVGDAHADEFCTATLRAQFVACRGEVRDDQARSRAICINVGDDAARDACFVTASESRNERVASCDEQRAARKALCGMVGEGRYDPDFSPTLFDSDFDNPTLPNPYRPLTIGNQWEYSGEGEHILIDVLDKTKLIDGVECIVVRDIVDTGGFVVEDTFDWFAQAKDGDVWYCGEEVKDYETFPGDVPVESELVTMDGSFKQGRDGDKGGVVFPASPLVGAVLRQEFSPGNAEDVMRILTTSYDYGVNPTLDQFVPQALAEYLCSNSDCVVTSEFSPMHPEPEAVERKYYARGIGEFFSVHEVTGDGVRLVGCNFDPRCTTLP